MKKFTLIVILLAIGGSILYGYSQTQKVVDEELPEGVLEEIESVTSSLDETTELVEGAEDSIEVQLQDPAMVEKIFPEDLSASEDPSTPQIRELTPIMEKAEDPSMTAEDLEKMEMETVMILNPDIEEKEAPAAVEAMPKKEMEEKAVQRQGSFVGQDSFHQGSGLALLIPSASLVRLQDFEVTRGPDLRVSAITKAGDRVDLGALKGNAGNQNYSIPSSTDPDDIVSIQIWCRAFNFTFAIASLN
jgi:hypothetical protein